MQNYCKLIGALAAASALVAGNASAEVEYEIHTGYSSEYIFRGIDLGNGLVEAGLDVSTEAYGLGFSAGAWYASFENSGLNITELDIYGEVSKDLGFAKVAVGYISYINDGGSVFLDDAQEVYFSVSKELFGLDTSLTYFWDIETDNDGYLEAYVGKSFELSPCLTLNTGGTLGYLIEQSDLAYFSAKVSLDWAFTETATLSPFVAYSNSFEGNYNNGDDEFIGGTMLSVSF